MHKKLMNKRKLKNKKPKPDKVNLKKEVSTMKHIKNKTQIQSKSQVENKGHTKRKSKSRIVRYSNNGYKANKKEVSTMKHIKNKAQTSSKVQVKNKKSSSHDNFFKDFYSKPPLVRELLSFIFSKKELKVYDLNKLKVEKDTFENKRADLVISCPFKDQPQTKVRIFILLEHKSQHDKDLFSQLLDYQCAMRRHSIKEMGYAQPIIPVLFYHGEKPSKWRRSLQEEDFDALFPKIPMESRKSMLNYRPKIIDTHNPKVLRDYKRKRFKGYGVVKLLSEIWSIKNPTLLKIKEVLYNFKDMFKGLTKYEIDKIVVSIYEYLSANTKLSLKLWEEAKELLKKEGIITKGGKTMDVFERIEERAIKKGEKRGRQEGRQEGRQAVILNMLKKKLDVSLISEVTGLSEKEIKKLKNGK